MMGKFDRLPQLLFLAVTVLIYNVMAMAIANSLFVSQVGAGQLPIAFMLIGLCSLPIYGAFSQVADRYTRPQMFRAVLLGSIALMLGLRWLVSLDTAWVYYVLLIVIFFQWDFYNNLLYPGLLTDYFTTIEYKRNAPYIGIAQAVGTLLGGGYTLLLSNHFPSRDLLWCLPGFMAIAFGQLVYLEKSQRRLQTSAKTEQISIVESLKVLPDLGQRYPLVLFLAASTFLLVIIYICSEFLWFNIYGQQFDESQLTGFLGLMRMVISAIQVVFLYGITRPLLNWIGVARLNAVFPITTLLSLAGLLFNLKLPMAIALHINGDALYKSINLPVHQLNYNGIPHQYIGRIRAVSDGLIYALGLTLAGAILWLCHLYLSLEQIIWLAIILTLLLLLVRLPMGKFYLQSLEDMIRTDAIDLNDFGTGQNQLPPQSSKVTREFLTDSDRYIQIKGLELAANLGNPEQFFSEVKTLLADADSDVREGVLQLYSQASQTSLLQFTPLLAADQPQICAAALEVLIINQYPFTAGELEPLIQNSATEVKALALVATFQNTPAENLDNKVKEQFWQIELTNETVKAIARVVQYSQNPEFITLLEYLLPQTQADARKAALNALANLAAPNDTHLAKIALGEVQHEDPGVRAAAYKILEITRCVTT
ncbi:MAG: cyclic nucleotide-binding domain-containing protein, partial [Cyanobacteria bacterium P01_C01_bin.72]